MKNYCYFKIIVTILFFLANSSYAKIKPTTTKKENRIASTNVAPIIKATGDQIYCKLTSQKIVTEITITDPDDIATDAIYIQISSGYTNGQDLLTLFGIHPTIVSSWDFSTGKLKLFNPNGLPVSYIDFIAAIKDVQYTNNSLNPSGTREFSISVGQANYLPSTNHYYQFVSSIGISWTDAKIAAENSTYYGLQGYLATITALDEALLVGEQASGTGWIGGSDAEQEGVWKWVTGPENGRIFWYGVANGSTPNFAYWNNGTEPNSQGDEDYAHITAPGIGKRGSWNDLSNTGEIGGDYQPKGYIVEYGGMPNDPVLEISSSTTITILSEPDLSSNRQICSNTTLTITADFQEGTLNWYSEPTLGSVLFTGNTFITPNLTQNTTYYYDYGCNERKKVDITVIQIPTIVSTNSPLGTCSGNSITLEAIPSSGTVNWYTSLTSTTVLVNNNNLTIPNITKSSTYYAEAIETNCSNQVRVPVTVTAYELPTVSDEEIKICEGIAVTLNAGISNMLYRWSTGETSQTIKSKELNNYSVIVTSLAPQNCSKTKNFNIIQIPKPSIKEVIVNQSQITIIPTQSGNFEYSIDGINYQNSTVFNVEIGGLYRAYVKDNNNCGKDSKSFVVISYPKFFTPNNDGDNDFWVVKGMENYSSAVIYIYDRYGKLITSLTPKNLGWNGTFNGQPLPATDYWFVSKINDFIPVQKGHFSLKR